MYVDANSLYGFTLCQKLPTKNFTFLQDISAIDEDFIKNYDENSDVGYIFEVGIEHPKHLHSLHSDLPFLPERMKINGCKKLVCNFYDKNNYVDYIRSLKQALNLGLVLKKVHGVIQFD